MTTDADAPTPATQTPETLPFDDDAWTLATHSARALLRRTQVGNAGALWAVTWTLMLAALWQPWTLLLAAFTTASAIYLTRAATWLAHSMYPATYTLTRAIGTADAADVCAEFVRNPPPLLEQGAHFALVVSIATQRAERQSQGCGQGHRALCPHRPPAQVEAPEAIRAALYG